MNYLLLATAIALSAISAYYSIVGLMAIFAAATIPIAVMGGTLEVAKIVLATWLKKNWETVPLTLKTYFVSSIVVLMIITSAGIFGFLSRAHLEQTAPMGDVVEKVSVIEEKIKIEKENIEVNRRALAQLNDAVDQTMSRSTSEVGAQKAVQVRRSQQAERTRLLKEIEVAQANISKLTEEKLPLASKVRQIEAEVGPIKYVASLFYDDTSKDTLEKAVIILILMFVFTFDPLAVLMFVAFAHSMKQKSPEPVQIQLSSKDVVEEIRPPEKDVISKIEPEAPLSAEGGNIEMSITSGVKTSDSMELTKN